MGSNQELLLERGCNLITKTLALEDDWSSDLYNLGARSGTLAKPGIVALRDREQRDRNSRLKGEPVPATTKYIEVSED